MAPLLEAVGLRRVFTVRQDRSRPFSKPDTVTAVDDVSFHIDRAEALGLIGESGSGKTTVGRCVCGLDSPTAGRILHEGTEIVRRPDALRRLRQNVQIVFQDSYLSMNPRMTVHQILEEPLRLLSDLPSREREARVRAILRDVGLHAGLLDRRRHQLSGGQQQRVNLARALVVRPRLVVLDEPLSSLDASLAHQMLRLLKDLRQRLDVSYLFISHDLSTVEGLCDRVLIMHRGRIVERGPVGAVFGSPQHPYTKLLFSARLTTAGSDEATARRTRWLAARREWLDFSASAGPGKDGGR